MLANLVYCMATLPTCGGLHASPGMATCAPTKPLIVLASRLLRRLDHVRVSPGQTEFSQVMLVYPVIPYVALTLLHSPE